MKLRMRKPLAEHSTESPRGHALVERLALIELGVAPLRPDTAPRRQALNGRRGDGRAGDDWMRSTSTRPLLTRFR